MPCAGLWHNVSAERNRPRWSRAILNPTAVYLKEALKCASVGFGCVDRGNCKLADFATIVFQFSGLLIHHTVWIMSYYAMIFDKLSQKLNGNARFESFWRLTVNSQCDIITL